MSHERFIIFATTVLSLTSIIYIPKARYRLALVSFLTFQTITWANCVMLVQFGLMYYPAREFVRATQVGFLINYLVFPMLYVWFILILPGQIPLGKKILHYLVFASLAVWFTYYISVYSNFQKLNGSLLLQVVFGYIRSLIYLVLCNALVSWFLHKTKTSTGG